MTTVGLLHPGEMGSAIGATLRDAGHTVLWDPAGRSPETHARTRAAGLLESRTAIDFASRPR
jgi:3-hydroxyisobutyrate dehydrogenase-like beta-hydroxyacid dehydrogenase